MASTSYSGDPNAFDISTFDGTLTGSCLCGGITVTIRNKPDLFKERNGHMCHCQNCRKITGCVASNNMVIEQANFTISDPEKMIKTYEDSNTGSGKMTPRSFCSNCSSPIFSLPTDDADEYYVIPLGIFPRIPAPEFELFGEHRHPWQAKTEGLRRYRFMSASGEIEE